MRLEFITHFDDKYVNTLNGKLYEPSLLSQNREIFFKRDKDTIVFGIIEDNTFYKYSVIEENNSLKLIVYKGIFNWNTEWKPIYSISIDLTSYKVTEEGQCDLDFWHEFFGTCYGMLKYREKYVKLFSLDNDSMKNIRKVFPLQLQENPFLVFKKFQTLKKFKKRYFDESIFNIPNVKINRMVGKKYDGTTINYTLQREIELGGEVFFDVTVITGPVKNGMIDIQEKHRFFITKDFIYSPDGGDAGVFSLQNTVGIVHSTKLKKKYPELMLDKYDGKYFYQYLFSKEFIPVFEILSKAGYQKLADLFLSEYYEEYNEKEIQSYETVYGINIYGKNDKEIFGFKMSKFKNIDPDAITSGPNRYSGSRFSDFIKKIKTINKYSSNLLDNFYIDGYLFDFLYQNARNDNAVDFKTVDYLKSIGTYKSNLYLDYLRMCKNAKRFSGGLYPKDLKYEHDVMISYTNQLREAKNNIQFKEQVDSPEYKSLLYEGSEYCILAPRVANDLVNESYCLHHCVRSYISDVATGHTRIYFLRKRNSKATPFVTIEVKNDEICQARGIYNRLISATELAFINEWCEEKGISISRYCVI